MKRIYKFMLGICVASLLVISCKKQRINEPEDPMTALMKLKDSCSYTIDGRQFICDQVTVGVSNAGVRLDTATGTYDPDSIQYHRRFVFSKTQDGNSSDNGYLNLAFVKKFAKSQMIQSGTFYDPSKQLQQPMFQKGMHPYAIDFGRTNTQDGVTMFLLNRTATSSNYLNSYINTSAYSPTTLGLDCQNNSSFEVKELHALSDGTYLMEANFTVNVFNQQEQLTRVENGYVRLRFGY